MRLAHLTNSNDRYFENIKPKRELRRNSLFGFNLTRDYQDVYIITMGTGIA